MALMVERSCAVVRVDGIAFLCLLRGAALAAAHVPFLQGDLRGSPLDGARVIEVMAGDEQGDFCWAGLSPGQAGTSLCSPQAGVAGAITARLYGLAPGIGRILGYHPASAAVLTFIPPAGAWWGGTWAAGPAGGTPAHHHATMLMHGEMVAQGDALAGLDPIPPPRQIPQE